MPTPPRHGRQGSATTLWITSESTEALTNLDPDELTVVNFTRELLQNRKVSQPTFDAVITRFGHRGMITLTNLVACYAVLAYNMNTYELGAPEHPTEKPLPV